MPPTKMPPTKMPPTKMPPKNMPPTKMPTNVFVEASQVTLGESEEPAYKLAQIEGKGRGLVATRTLEVGELVFSEKAFLKAPRQATWGFYKSLFSRLEPDIRAKLMNLTCPEERTQDLEDNKILLMKFQANCFELDDEDEDEA